MFKKLIYAFISIVNVFIYYIRFYKKNYLCLFALQPSSLKFMQPLIDQLDLQNNVKYILLTTSKEYKNVELTSPILYINPILWQFMKGGVLISGNSGVPKNLINGFQRRIHSFHSPISILRIYPENAFDAFNYFFTAGKHHEAELKYLFEKRRLPCPVIFETGYMRIESIYNFNQSYTKTLSGGTVIIAPSWGEFNIINMFGYQMISSLLNGGHNVILRPHPGNEIHNADDIDKIKNDFSSNPKFYYDTWDNMDLLCEADIMIGDWSGISFEFALALNKPVIFVDTKPKNNTNITLPFEVFEDYARESVGRVISEDKVDDIENIVADIHNNYRSYKQKIISNKSQLIFNCPKSSNEVFSCVSKLIL